MKINALAHELNEVDKRIGKIQEQEQKIIKINQKSNMIEGKKKLNANLDDIMMKLDAAIDMGVVENESTCSLHSSMPMSEINRRLEKGY